MSAWHWTRLVPTAGGRLGTVGVGAVTVQDWPGAYRRPYVFVLDEGGNLWINWYDGTAWQVLNRGTPGVPLRTPVGALAVQDSSVAPERPYVFLWGSDNNLWLNWWNGREWLWDNRRNPGSFGFRGEVAGALSARFASSGSSNPFAFIVGDSGGTGYDLWVNWWDGSMWQWTRHSGQPTIDGDTFPGLGATTVEGVPYAFIQASTDVKAWVNWYDGNAWQWTDLSLPPDRNSPNANLYKVGAVAVRETATGSQHPYFFVQTSSGNLWLRSYDGSTWQPWQNLGTPGLIGLGSPAGLISVRSSPTAPEQPYIFFLCNDANLWVNTWNGTTSVWTNQGHPSADVGIVANGGLGTVVLQDTPMAQERPYVFVQGSDGYLWANWWSA